MALILDHINGVATDNRLENLQIVCPNCAATLDTHCGRNLPRREVEIECAAVRDPLRPAASRAALLLSGAAERATHALEDRVSRRGGSSGRRTSSSCVRSRSRATSRSAGATACRTTRSGSGSGPTSASWARRRCRGRRERGDWVDGGGRPASDDPGAARAGDGRRGRPLRRAARVRGAPSGRRVRGAGARRRGAAPVGGGRRGVARPRGPAGAAGAAPARSRSSPGRRARGSRSATWTRCSPSSRRRRCCTRPRAAAWPRPTSGRASSRRSTSTATCSRSSAGRPAAVGREVTARRGR